MVIFREAQEYVFGYHGSPCSDAGLAMKTGKFDGGVTESLVLFSYANFKDAIDGRDIRHKRYGGYGRFITELKIPKENMALFDLQGKLINSAAWNLPSNVQYSDINNYERFAYYCYRNSSKTKHIWGGISSGVVVLFRRDAIPKVANREMDQFEEKWHPIGTLPRMFPDDTLVARDRSTMLVKNRSKSIDMSKDPSKMPYMDRIVYWQKILYRSLTALELSALKNNPQYRPQ